MTFRASLLFAIAAIWPAASVAASLDNLLAALLSQNPTTDYDVHSLLDFSGEVPLSTPLNYNSNTTAGGWTSTLTGNYLGQPLSVTYLGNLAGYPGAPVTWTSTGTFGADSWTGSGSLAFSGNAANFQIDVASNLQVGSNTVVDSAILSGTSSPTNVELTTLSSTEILNGTTLPGHIMTVTMDAVGRKRATCSMDGTIGGAILNDWELITGDLYSGTISSAPEPSSLGVVLMPLACLALFRLWRRLEADRAKSTTA